MSLARVAPTRWHRGACPGMVGAGRSGIECCRLPRLLQRSCSSCSIASRPPTSDSEARRSAGADPLSGELGGVILHQEETYFSYRTSLPQYIKRRGKTSNTLRRFTEVVPLGESLPGERLWTVRGEGADYKPF